MRRRVQDELAAAPEASVGEIARRAGCGVDLVRRVKRGVPMGKGGHGGESGALVADVAILERRGVPAAPEQADRLLERLVAVYGDWRRQRAA